MRAAVCCLIVLAQFAGASGVRAQDTLPPAFGGRVQSLGLPEVYHPYAAVALGRDGSRDGQVAGQVRLGLSRPVGSPVFHVLSVAGEAYAGVRDVRPAYGVRGLVVSNALMVGAGYDYDLAAGHGDPVLMFVTPVRRAGVVGRGSGLRIEWLPTRGHSVNAGLTVPLRRAHNGRTRPHETHVTLQATPPRPIPHEPDRALADALARLRESAHWVNRLTLVPLGGGGRDRAAAVADAAAPLRARLAVRTADEEILAYHAEVAHAFSLAVSGLPLPAGRTTALGERVAEHAMEVLLERVLFPYNRLLGQWKRDDTTLGFAATARGVFARWLVTRSDLPPDRTDAVSFVFQHLLDVVEEVRAANRAYWGDSRLGWLPLQLALAPHRYDEQEELDSLVSRAVGRTITHGNRMWYVHNDRFLTELVKSIAAAEEYHLLWVHDFRGVTGEGRPDRLSLFLVTQAYFQALRDRVAAYDSTGRLPVFMLFLDQHYFEMNRSRDLLNLLQDPLGRRLKLPAQYRPLGEEIARWQEELRQTVDASRLLTAERAEYGERWLRDLIKVHVSVTNQADPSFRSRQIMPVMGMPDDVMRDHRKVVLYDVSEEDPYRGMAMYAGHGVGEHYAGPSWEDRALMLQGPAALGLRDHARALLEQQGLKGGAVPHVLRPRPGAPDYDARVRAEIESQDAWGGVATRAVELHNATGFGAKEIAVADATVFNLTSPGGVLKAPDSLWLNEFLASLLGGAALRGTRVLVVAPSLASAPAPGLGMPIMHDLFSRLVAFARELDREIAAAGGLFRPGLYDAEMGVYELDHRVHAFGQSLARHGFLRDLYAFDPAALGILNGGGASGGSLVPADTAVRAKLHSKSYLYVSREAWARLVSGAPMAAGVQAYLAERARQLREGPTVDEELLAAALQQVGARTINPVLEALPDGERARWAFFLRIGSPNLDYRSMVMDGEAAVLVSGWTALYALPDFVLLMGLVTWIEAQAELDRLLPSPGGMKRGLTRWLRMAL